MASAIEDYALLGNTRTAALVSREGSIDWFCAPRFDSPAAFAALLGSDDHGRWRITPAASKRTLHRSYRPGTLILETDYETREGAVRVTDCMPILDGHCEIVRIVRGLRGSVPIRFELSVRFDYGSTIPWVWREGQSLYATAGPDALRLRAGEGVELRPDGFHTVADFRVEAGQRVPFVLSHYASHEPAPFPLDPTATLDATEAWWHAWSDGCKYEGPWKEAVVRSLITLKALIHAPTGGMVAAATTSLPEQLGGSRNWDYRYCWVRDATFSLYALLIGGYLDEARDWRRWLLRAAAGCPSDLQVLYGIAGERSVVERTLPWLPGYESSEPVRVGNAAAGQVQLDVYGELVDALHGARAAGLELDRRAWDLQRALLGELERVWDRPDQGIWEIRAEPRHFTHSKVMAWVAFDRAVKACERFGLDGPVARWKELRDTIHAAVCRDGFSRPRGTFVQSFGSDQLDASLLLLPMVGFLPANDLRMRATTEAISRELTADGYVRRYLSEDGADGLPPGEGVFLPCSFWLADNLALQGRTSEAGALFERLLSLRNDVGLYAEEYDPDSGRMLGNFPQAFTHVMLVNTAHNLARADARVADHHRALHHVEFAARRGPVSNASSPKVLVVDVGGTHVKVLASGVDEARKIDSGSQMTAKEMVDAVRATTSDWSYDVVSIGYPGPVRQGRPLLEPQSLGEGWVRFDYAAAFGCPVRIVNDAVMQALGSYEGGGMLFLGLGTGLGSALIIDGIVEPLELARLPYRKGHSFEHYLGARGLERLGKSQWRRAVFDVVERLRSALQVDYIVLGGGNVSKLEELPPNVRRGSNEHAFTGGFRLWEPSRGHDSIDTVVGS